MLSLPAVPGRRPLTFKQCPAPFFLLPFHFLDCFVPTLLSTERITSFSTPPPFPLFYYYRYCSCYLLIFINLSFVFLCSYFLLHHIFPLFYIIPVLLLPKRDPKSRKLTHRFASSVASDTGKNEKTKNIHPHLSTSPEIPKTHGPQPRKNDPLVTTTAHTTSLQWQNEFITRYNRRPTTEMSKRKTI